MHPHTIRLWTLFYLTFISCILVRTQEANSASTKKLETILYHSPNIELSEFLLVKNNNLEASLQSILKAKNHILQSNETSLIQNIRLAHLHFLTAYAHTYHISNQLTQSQKREKAFATIDTVITLGEKITKQVPYYSDIYRIMSVSMMLCAQHGMIGISKFLLYQQKMLEYIQKAMDLYPNNPMARVVLSNFDALGNFIVGSNRERGKKIIFMPINNTWPKVYRFELLNSQAIVYKVEKDIPQYQSTLRKMHQLYTQSWRYKLLESY